MGRTDTPYHGDVMEIKKDIIHVMGGFMGECAKLPMNSQDADTIAIVKLIIGQIETATLLTKTVNAYEGTDNE